MAAQNVVVTGDQIRCSPDNIKPPQLTATVSCVGIVTGVFEDDFAVHYFLPEGANGYTRFHGPPADGPVRGGWWFP